jgi:hypothetical protein
LRRKFSQLYKTSAPTGDPDIPANVLRAKAIRNDLETRADTVNLSANLFPGGDDIPIAVGDMGFPDDDEVDEVLDEDQELYDGNDLGRSVSVSQQGSGPIRRVREVAPRPLVRPQAIAGRPTLSNSDAIQAMLMNMMQERRIAEDERREERQRYDERMEERREDRRQQMEAQRQQMEAQQQMQQMNMTMMMAMIKSANPSASSIMNQANRKRSRQNDTDSDE